VINRIITCITGHKPEPARTGKMPVSPKGNTPLARFRFADLGPVRASCPDFAQAYARRDGTDRVVAFARCLGSSVAIAVVPRAVARMVRADASCLNW
jgi:hypothetical protein